MQNPFDREELQAPLAEINTTPLVDVMLVLLVIFLVTAPILNGNIKLNLPDETASQITEKKPVTILIDAKGQYYLQGQFISFEELKKKLKIAARGNIKQSIHIRADVEVTYGKVSHLLATLQQLGFSNIGFITQQK
jgi:biopolymer transport protein ExbD